MGKRLTLLCVFAAAFTTAATTGTATAGAPDRHGSGPRPLVLAVTDTTRVSGGPGGPIHVAYVDSGCRVVGGTWTDQYGVAHDFAAGGPNDVCFAGIGRLTPGEVSCTSPTGDPGTPGSYPQSIVLRDAKGNVSDPFAFSVVCVAP